MVTLVGYVEGVEISFDFYPPDTFVGVIPKKLDSKYVVELRAIDSAGNITGKTDLYVLIDFQQLTFTVLKDTFQTCIKPSDFDNKELILEFTSQSEELEYDFAVVGSNYTYREVVSE